MYTLLVGTANGDWTEVCKSSIQGCKNKAAKLNRSEFQGNLGKEFLIRHGTEDLIRSVKNGSCRMEWVWAGKQDLTCFANEVKKARKEAGRDLE